jgi:hypothetical protein
VPLTRISSPPRGSVRSLDDPNLQASPFLRGSRPTWQLKPAPYAQPVECTSQVIFNYWLRRADDFANFTVRKPLPDQAAIWIGFAVSRSRGILRIASWFSKAAIAELHAFAPIPDSGTRKKPSQVLLYSARTDAQPAGDFPVAAALHEQNKHLLVSGRHLHSLGVTFTPMRSITVIPPANLNLLHRFGLHMFRQIFARHCARVRPASTCTYGQGRVFQKKFRKRVLDLTVPVWEGREEGNGGQ